MDLASLFLLLASFSYVIGSVPFHRMFGLNDIDRSSGSTAYLRSLIRYLLNMTKGFGVVYLGMTYGAYPALVCLFFVCLGHNYPIWTTFKGGTGLGTIVGGMAAIDPALCLTAVALWGAGFYVFHKTSAAAIATASLTPLGASFIDLPFPTWTLVPLAALVLWRHRIVFRKAFECPTDETPAGLAPR